MLLCIFLIILDTKITKSIGIGGLFGIISSFLLYLFSIIAIKTNTNKEFFGFFAIGLFTRFLVFVILAFIYFVYKKHLLAVELFLSYIITFLLFMPIDLKFVK